MSNDCNTKQNPLVSVIMPVYNLENYVSRGIESVLRQTYSNIELLIVDDGSKDGTGAVLKKYEQADSRVVVITQENAGVSAARNHALSRATGEYICFLDGDDWLADDAIETLVKAAEEHEGQLIVSAFELAEEGNNFSLHKPSATSEKPGYTCLNQKQALMSFDNEHYFLSAVWAKLFSRKVIQENKLSFDRDLIIGEDTVFVFKYLSFVEGLYWLPEAKLIILERAGSATRSGYSEKLDTALTGIERMVAWASDGEVKRFMKGLLARLAMRNQMLCVLDHKTTRKNMRFYRELIKANRRFYIARYPGLYYKLVSLAACWFPAWLLEILYKVRFGKDVK